MLHRLAVLATVLALQFQYSNASAQWVSDGVPVCTAINEQSGWVSAPGDAGGLIIVWRDFRSEATGNVFGQQISASGAAMWTANGVSVCGAVGYQQSLSIASDGSAGVIVAWEDWRSGTSDIYAQRVSPTGARLWTNNGNIVCNSIRGQTVPLTASDGAGGAIIAWGDERNAAGHTRDIYAQRLDGSGAALWTTNGVPVASVGTGDVFINAIASDGAGGAIVTWYGNGGTTIRAQRIDASGAQVWPAPVPVCIAVGSKNNVQVVTDGAGGGIFAWQDNRSGAQGTYMQLVSAAGSALWTTDGIRESLGGYFSSMISDGSGGAIIAYATSAVDQDVYAQRVDALGSVLWGAGGLAVCTETGNQFAPTLTPDGVGGVFVTWDDGRNGTDVDLYAQQIDAGGTPMFTAQGGVAVSAAPGNQMGGAVGTGAGFAIAAFIDTRSAAAGDVYAMEIGELATAVGTKGTPAFTLGANRPNPFSDATTLELELKSEASVHVDVFDVGGRRVSSQAYSRMPAGPHSLRILSRDTLGRPLASGVYFARVTVAGETITRKLVIAR